MTVLVGVIPLAAGVLLCATIQMSSPILGALGLLLCYALPLMFYEIFVRRTHHNPTTGLNWQSVGEANPKRVLYKLIGMAAILSTLVAAHAIIRIYTMEQLQAPFAALKVLLPAIVTLLVAYFWFLDKRMVQPKDGYWQIGTWLSGQNPSPDWPVLKDFLLGWIVKGFFLPIMFTYLVQGVVFLQNHTSLMQGGPVEIALYLIRVAIILELTVVVVGYTMTARFFDAHIRSTNTYLAAWVVTLACYQPFNLIVFDRIFPFRSELDWSHVIAGYPSFTFPWIILILLSFVAYVWATAIYGLRWSNLTNRGIITTGPYRFTKHPDYVSKSAYFWLTAAPFLTAATTWGAIAGSFALLGVNIIYYGRARMEEKHLSEDPDYVAYALAMNERSIFRGLVRLLPFLRYQAPKNRIP